MTGRSKQRADKQVQPKSDTAAQYARFVETARKLGCDQDKERFEAQLGKIAKAKPARDRDTPSD